MMRSGWRGSLAFVLALCACSTACQPLPPPTQAILSATITPRSSVPTPTPLPAATSTLLFTSSPSPSVTGPAPTPAPAPLATLLSVTPQPLSERARIAYDPWSLVLALGWSPDGDLLAAVAGDKVYIYNAKDLELRQTLNIGVWVNSLAFWPGGRAGKPLILALAVRDGAIQLWNASTGQPLASFMAHTRGANSVAFSPDGALLASSGNNGIVRLWNLSAFLAGTSQDIPVQAEMIGGAYAVPSVCFSPDGKTIASVDLHNIRIRSVETQRLERTLRGEAPIFSIVFNPDGKLLAAGEMNNVVRLWDVASGEAAATLSTVGRPGSFIWSVAFSPDGSLLASGSSDGTITLWDVQQQALIVSVSGHARGVPALGFRPDGQVLASAGLDAVLRLWEYAEAHR